MKHTSTQSIIQPMQVTHHLYTTPSKLPHHHPKLPLQIDPLLPLDPLNLPRQLLPQQPRKDLPLLIIQILPLPPPKHNITHTCLPRPGSRRPIRRSGNNMEMNMRDLLCRSDAVILDHIPAPILPLFIPVPKEDLHHDPRDDREPVPDLFSY
ncbi:uncharacterized protein BO80DRAFT_424972 [Aspergillus ibericus CBS 121593]|uniref:Uncharacterized protein n=1 Tax=Aspergillus ibericus CBS 121593 TaxID=1448316 RepID=A0A395GZI3_9EURO|nr:hypothetical protein BO80DRAFT_424972 [Aspergillus ibericus CBS 121593]RAL01001.1 hypothetical protein BO80DRAFT_424972 [Aspergillus ibericus CBS 121593]